MATFPTLRTGAIAQYPLPLSREYHTQFVTFLDGSRQTYRIRKAGLRKWRIWNHLLDDEELEKMCVFFRAQGETPFSFTDPITGETAQKCMYAGWTFTSEPDGQGARSTTEIEEIA